MNTSGSELPDIYLHPGEMFISDRPALVSTVLGSCISVTFFSPRLKVGAICHGLLPTCKKEKASCAGNCADGLRYVECSIKRMTKQFTALGIRNSEIEVKVFGGADMIKYGLKNGNPETVGRQNTKIALSTLKDRNFQVKAFDTGGSRGRKLIFFSHTGEVFLKRLSSNEMEPQV